jgi:hypothetical protein
MALPVYEHDILHGSQLYGRRFNHTHTHTHTYIYIRYHDQNLFSIYSYLNIKPSGGNYISIHYTESVKTLHKKA